jgi:hypothetical protein
MVNTIVIVGIGFVVLLAAFLVYAATRPDTFRIRRATSIKAPPEKIFPLIDDLRAQATWSPWEKKDPAMKRNYSGPASGKGAAYEWDGNKEIGKGRIEIADTSRPSKVTLKLDFVRPFEAHNIVEFTLDAKGDATDVTWSMHGPQPLMAKIMGIFIDCDKMVGKEFEAGLANLKAVAER